MTVRLDDGNTVNCKMRGVLRLKGLRCTNPVAVGDRVQVEDKGGDAPVIIVDDEAEGQLPDFDENDFFN